MNITSIAKPGTVRPSWLPSMQSMLLDQPAVREMADLRTLVGQAAAGRGRPLVTIEAEDDLPALWCTPGPVEIALSCLIDNAVQAAETGAEPSVRVTLCRVEHEIRIAIVDNGPGFGTPVGHAMGAGTGLTIARTIVERHGGQLWFATDVTGTIACIALPIEPVRSK